MPVDSRTGVRRRTRQVDPLSRLLCGQRCVKVKGTDYLPKLSGQSVQEYDAYVKRALFYPSSTAR